jgi:YaaC-like protein
VATSERFSDAWGDLRSLRSSPPGFASEDPARREVFLAALEQSEQLLRGAADLGFASRPLSLFYGLSQAGRAITAAWSHPVLSEGSADLAWQLAGHGIKFAGSVDDMVLPRLDQLELMDAPQEPLPATSKKRLPAFPAVARVLGSASLLRTARLVDLWSALPEAVARPAPGHADRWPPIFIDWSDLQTMTLTHNWSSKLFDEWANLSLPDVDERIRDILEHHYPAMPFAVPDHHQLAPSYGDPRGALWLDQQPVASAGGRPEYGDPEANYRGRYFAVPRVNGQEVQPLLIWWAVLFALSMLARYYPRTWAQAIDVNSSEWATPLEHLMTEAVTALPEVIFEALEAPPATAPFPLSGEASWTMET